MGKTAGQYPDQDYLMQSIVGTAVTASAEPVSGCMAGRGRYRIPCQWEGLAGELRCFR